MTRTASPSSRACASSREPEARAGGAARVVGREGEVRRARRDARDLGAGVAERELRRAREHDGAVSEQQPPRAREVAWTRANRVDTRDPAHARQRAGGAARPRVGREEEVPEVRARGEREVSERGERGAAREHLHGGAARPPRRRRVRQDAREVDAHPFGDVAREVLAPVVPRRPERLGDEEDGRHASTAIAHRRRLTTSLAGTRSGA
jgi:hypothetical protein